MRSRINSEGEKQAPFSRPRNIGLPKVQGKGIYEFAVYGKYGFRELDQINAELLENHVKIINQSVEKNQEHETSSTLYHLDLLDSKLSPRELVDYLNTVKGVENVQYSSREGSLFGFFSFPVLLNGCSRAYVMRGEMLMRIEEKLVEALGFAGESIMFQEGREYGFGVMDIHQEALGKDADLKTRVRNMKDAAKITGFGIFDYTFSQEMKQVLAVVKEPLTNSRGQFDSMFFFGIIAGSIEAVHGIKLRLRDHSFDKTNRVLQVSYLIANQTLTGRENSKDFL